MIKYTALKNKETMKQQESVEGENYELVQSV